MEPTLAVTEYHTQQTALRLKTVAPGALCAGVVGVALVMSRTVLYWMGLRFEASGLEWYWQFLEPELLANDLLRSLYYLHMQPPLFNLFLGVMLKCFPGNLAAAFAVVYLVLGLVLAISLCLLMVRLGGRPWVSAGLTILFMVSPAAILYENYLFYTYPVATLLVLTALFLHRYLSSGRFREALVFFVLLAMVALTRSLFHLVWFVAVVLLVFWAAPRLRRRTLTSAVVPFLAIVGWYLKNLIVFGSFGASTWMGMNLWKSATWNVNGRERAELIAEGVLSPLAEVKAFRPLADYAEFLPPADETGVAALDRELKSEGTPNFNNIRYVEISRQNRRDAWALFKRYPLRRGSAVLHAFCLYFVPASDYAHLHANRRRIVPWERVYDVVCGQAESLPTEQAEHAHIPRHGWDRLRFVGISLVIALPVLFVYGCRRVRRAWPHRHGHLAATVTVAFCCLNIAFVTLVGNVFELGENMRFRFLIDPLYLVLLGLLLNDWLDRRRRKPPRRAVCTENMLVS